MKSPSFLKQIWITFGTVIFLSCQYPLWVSAQKKALNIAGIHQLVADSKSEYDRQNNTRNNQAIATANEQANKTMLAKLKTKYRELQQRYHALGTIINAANIGIYASPMISRIVNNQIEIYRIANANPAFIATAYQTEKDFVIRSQSLLNYLIGLCASFGAVNQMKASDRKILFDHILVELNTIQELSANLLNTMKVSQTAGLIRSLNPFQNYIDQDKEIVHDIIRNAGYLKK